MVLLGSEAMAGAIVGVQAAAASVVVSASVVAPSAAGASRLATDLRLMPLPRLASALAVDVEAMAAPTVRIALVSEEAYDVAQLGAVLKAPGDAALTASADGSAGGDKLGLDGGDGGGVPVGVVIGSVAAAVVVGGVFVALVCCHRRKRDGRRGSSYPPATLKELSVAFLQRLASPLSTPRPSAFSSPRARTGDRHPPHAPHATSCTSSTTGEDFSPGRRFARLDSMSGDESTTAPSPFGGSRLGMPPFAEPIVAIHPIGRGSSRRGEGDGGGGEGSSSSSVEMNTLGSGGGGGMKADVGAGQGHSQGDGAKADGENKDAVPLAATIVAEGTPVTQVGEGVWMDGSTLRI